MRNGKKVAIVVDDGWGGGLQFYWIDSDKHSTTEYQEYNYAGQLQAHKGTTEEALFANFVLKQPQYKGYNDEMRHPNADIVIDDMVNQQQLEKKIASELKKKVIAEVDDKVLTFKTPKGALLEQVMKQVQAKYPKANILNNLSISEVIDVYNKHNLIA